MNAPPFITEPVRRHKLGLRASHRFLGLIQQGRAPDFYDEAIYAADLTEMRTLLGPLFIVNRSDLIEHVLLANSGNFVKGRMVQALFRKTLGTGLLISEGEIWRRQRRLSAPAFQPRRVEEAGSMIVERVARRMAAWAPQSRGFDLEKEFGLLTLEVISKVLFSHEIGTGEPLFAAIRDIVRHNRLSLADFLNLPRWVLRWNHPRLTAGVRTIDDLVRAILAERQAAAKEPHDLLGHLMRGAEAERTEDAFARIRDSIVTMLFAGHDTTAAGLAWTSHLLALHPQVQERARQEAQEVIGDGPLLFEQIDRLVYTRQVIDEAMRLFPPAHMMARVTVADDRLGGIRVPRGSTVVISPYVTHRNARYWPSPLTFDPSRFAPERCRERARFAYFPFGGGPRVCIGQGLALVEMTAVVSLMLRRHVLTTALRPGETPRLHGRVTLRPEGDLGIALHDPSSHSWTSPPTLPQSALAARPHR